MRSYTLPGGAVVDVEPRCSRCNRKLGEYVGRPWSLTCTRSNCHQANASDGRELIGALDNRVAVALV